MKIDAVIIKEEDNVATALRDILQGEKIVVDVGSRKKEIVVKEYIPYGHKFAVKKIVHGEHIIKYGEIIGRATQNIALGSHVHIQNVESLRGRGDIRSQE